LPAETVAMGSGSVGKSTATVTFSSATVALLRRINQHFLRLIRSAA
jgi:hypothetical protein